MTLAVAEGILPLIRNWVRPAGESIVSSAKNEGLAPTTAGSGGARTAAPTNPLVPLEGLAARQTVDPASSPDLSVEELRALLQSSQRIDQIRAIELLRRQGSSAANQILVDAFVGTKDPVLLALLEEAMLESPDAFAVAVMDAFLEGNDPALLSRLTGLLAGFVERRPQLEREVVGNLMDAMAAADESPARAEAATNGLAALGARIADQLAGYLVGHGTDAKGVGSAAWLIAQFSGEHADLVRD